MKQQFYLHFETMPKGTAQQKGVSIIHGKPHFYEKANVRETRQELTQALTPYRPKKPSTLPIVLKVWFYFDTKDKKKWNQPKPTRPDTDNLQKLLKDCMTDVGFWLDDAQVVEETVGKYYAEKATIAVYWEEVQKNE